MRSIGDEDPLSTARQALCFELIELFEEGGDVDDAAGADKVDFAGRVDQAGGQDMEVVGHVADDDGMAGVIAAGGAAAEVGACGEDVDKLAFALVAPLRAEDERDGHNGGKLGE